MNRAFFLCAFLRDADKNPSPLRVIGRQNNADSSVTFCGAFAPIGTLDSVFGPIPAFFAGAGHKFEGGAAIMAKAGNRVKITLRCSECKQRNYNTNKNKRNTTEKLELNKYCPFCRKHTLHTETK